MPLRPRLLAVVLVTLALGMPGTARANGRFPRSVDVIFKPGDHQVLGLAVTWGFLLSTDGGDTWAWACESAVGFGGVYDPDFTFTSTGLLLATTTSNDSLRLTRDFCTWTPAPPPLGSTIDGVPGTFVAQVEVGFDGTIYAAASTADDSHIYVSTDDGVSFAIASDPGNGVDWWETLVVSPVPLTGNATRLYLAGYNLGVGGVKERLLFRSDDGALTWTPLPITDFTFGGNLADLQIAAVSPDDADLVFARVFKADGSNLGDAIYRSADAGASWTKVFEAPDDVPVVLVRDSGDVVVATRSSDASALNSGAHLSTDGGQTFGVGILGRRGDCLRERDDGLLFACADSFKPDLMALGTGTTLGSYTTMLTFDQVDGLIECAAGTTQSVCDPLWCGVVSQFGIDEQACIVVDAGVSLDAGIVDPPKTSCTDCSSGAPGSALLTVLVVAPFLRRRRRIAS